MDNNPSPEADKTPEASPDAPFTRFIELDGRSPFHRSFVLRGLLRSPGSSRRRGSAPRDHGECGSSSDFGGNPK
jgi:hypothetical protein